MACTTDGKTTELLHGESYMSDEIGKLGTGFDLGPMPRFEPEPASSISFTKVINGLVNVARGAAGTATDPLGFKGTLDDLVGQQIEVQKLMLETSLKSNLEKARHDMEMAPVRNIRVS